MTTIGLFRVNKAKRFRLKHLAPRLRVFPPSSGKLRFQASKLRPKVSSAGQPSCFYRRERKVCSRRLATPFFGNCLERKARALCWKCRRRCICYLQLDISHCMRSRSNCFRSNTIFEIGRCSPAPRGFTGQRAHRKTRTDREGKTRVGPTRDAKQIGHGKKPTWGGPR